MKKQSGILRRLIALALILCMLTALTAEIFAADIVASGNCGANGSNLTWTLDSEGTLTISGKGEMSNYTNMSPWGYYSWYKKETQIRKVIIESGVTTIGNYAFYGEANLTNISVPDGITSIGKMAFEGCKKLDSIILLNSLTEIGDSAFSVCTNLTSIALPEKLEKIDWYAFSGCTGLTEIIIPQSVTYIGSYAFQNCKNLRCAYFRGDIPSVWLSPSAFGPCASDFAIYYIQGKNGWTDSSAYDGSTETWNGYPLKTWNGKTIPTEAKVSIPKGKYCIQVIDETGAAISGADVTWNATSNVTNQEGKVFFDLTTAGNPVIRVTKTDYLTWTNENTDWQKNEKRFERVILYPESYGGLKLKSAKIGRCDLLTQTKVLNLRNDGALIGDLNSGYFDLSCAATDTSAVKSMQSIRIKRKSQNPQTEISRSLTSETS